MILANLRFELLHILAAQADGFLPRFGRGFGGFGLRRFLSFFLFFLHGVFHVELAENAGFGIIHLALRRELRALLDGRDAKRLIRRHVLRRAAAVVFALLRLMRRILGRGGRDKFIRLKFGRRHNLPVVRLLIRFLLGFLFRGLAGLRAHVLRAAAALAEGIAHVRGKQR